MSIQIINSVQNLEIETNQTENGEIVITIRPNEIKTLSEFKPGSTVKIGEREYIVLEQSGDTTALITKEFVKTMAYSDANGDYASSDVRRYLTTEFYAELENAVGAENIIPHTVRMEAHDGTGKNNKVIDCVSLLTEDLYRRYREHLPAYGNWWWLATRVSYDDDLGYSRDVCYVYVSGIPYWDDCFCVSGVRPFCILNSRLPIKA